MSISAAAATTDMKTRLDGTSSNNAKILYIPQGFSGRLTLDSAAYGIEGFYRDDFSVCNILVCISKDKKKAIASHLDEYVCKFAWEQRLSFKYFRNIPKKKSLCSIKRIAIY